MREFVSQGFSGLQLKNVNFGQSVAGFYFGLCVDNIILKGILSLFICVSYLFKSMLSHMLSMSLSRNWNVSRIYDHLMCFNSKGIRKVFCYC